jgi:hypothetical protein
MGTGRLQVAQRCGPLLISFPLAQHVSILFAQSFGRERQSSDQENDLPRNRDVRSPSVFAKLQDLKRLRRGALPVFGLILTIYELNLVVRADLPIKDSKPYKLA